MLLLGLRVTCLPRESVACPETSVACPETSVVKGLNGYMVKFVRLPFYERSEMKRLSRTNPDLSGW